MQRVTRDRQICRTPLARSGLTRAPSGCSRTGSSPRYQRVHGRHPKKAWTRQDVLLSVYRVLAGTPMSNSLPNRTATNWSSCGYRRKASSLVRLAEQDATSRRQTRNTIPQFRSRTRDRRRLNATRAGEAQQVLPQRLPNYITWPF